MVEVKVVESYKDYGKCLSIANGVIEAYVTVDLGPRIIKFGYVGGNNFMNDNRSLFPPKPFEKSYMDLFGEGKTWENFGGHRIWVSPESYPETYLPDDTAVDYEITENGVILKPQADTPVGIKKTMELKMDNYDANMQVIMRVENVSDKDKEFAIWALSVCSQDGTLIVPTNTNDTGLLSNRKYIVWPYTDMTDDRIYWGTRYVTVRQEKEIDPPAKLGFDLNCGTAYYVLGDDILYKRYNTNHPDGVYPDGGASERSDRTGRTWRGHSTRRRYPHGRARRPRERTARCPAPSSRSDGCRRSRCGWSGRTSSAERPRQRSKWGLQHGKHWARAYPTRK